MSISQTPPALDSLVRLELAIETLLREHETPIGVVLGSHDLSTWEADSDDTPAVAMLAATGSGDLPVVEAALLSGSQVVRAIRLEDTGEVVVVPAAATDQVVALLLASVNGD